MIYLVRNDAVEGVDYDLTALTELLNRTMTEDKYITDNNQLGISSVAYTPCPLSLEESRVADFHRWYIHNCEAR
jgi:Rieske 2Fe-2S family protein